MSELTLFEKVELLQNLLVARSTGLAADDNEYKVLRDELLKNPTIKPILPHFVRTCRELDQFWSFIKFKFSTYQERRQYLWVEFAPVLEQLETGDNPINGSLSDTLESFESEYVKQFWETILHRLPNDPDGAITIARSLLEAICKHILDEFGVSYSEKDDLPRLYRLTSEQLNLAPSQHSEQIFKQILGGCQTVVEGLGAIRNKLGDAHGQGKIQIRPSSRHAELAVNLAGTMAIFLIKTFEYKTNQKT